VLELSALFCHSDSIAIFVRAMLLSLSTAMHPNTPFFFPSLPLCICIAILLLLLLLLLLVAAKRNLDLTGLRRKKFMGLVPYMSIVEVCRCRGGHHCFYLYMYHTCYSEMSLLMNEHNISNNRSYYALFIF
jgi:hypothetical protein